MWLNISTHLHIELWVIFFFLIQENVISFILIFLLRFWAIAFFPLLFLPQKCGFLFSYYIGYSYTRGDRHATTEDIIKVRCQPKNRQHYWNKIFPNLTCTFFHYGLQLYCANCAHIILCYSSLSYKLYSFSSLGKSIFNSCLCSDVSTLIDLSGAYFLIDPYVRCFTFF